MILSTFVWTFNITIASHFESWARQYKIYQHSKTLYVYVLYSTFKATYSIVINRNDSKQVLLILQYNYSQNVLHDAATFFSESTMDPIA